LRATLIESRMAACRSKGTCLGDQYRRLARRHGDKKAIIAIAHEILTATWHMLIPGELYREQNPQVVSERDAENARRRAPASSSVSATTSRSRHWCGHM